MENILQILGIAFIVALVFIITAVLFIRMRIRKIARELDTLSEDLKGLEFPPSRIHLESIHDPEYDHPTELEEVVESFESSGFTNAGVYQIPEMNGLLIVGMVLEDENIMGVIYDHPTVGVFCDMSIHYEDGSSSTVSNVPVVMDMDRPVNSKKHIDKEASPEKLLEWIRSTREEKAVKKVTIQSFTGEFERAYADEMEWRLARGGASEEELRRIAGSMEEEITEENIQESRERIRFATAEMLSDSCIIHFLENTEMSAVEWEKMRRRVVAIHDQMPVEDAILLLAEGSGMDYEELLEGLNSPGMSTRVAFTWANEKLPDKVKYSRIGETEKPVKADIYQSKRDIT